MAPLWLLVLAPLVHAQTYITDISDEVELSLAGGWARVFPADEGWHFLWAAGGDFVLLPMTDDYEVKDRGRKNLTGDSDMIDHAITTCPDGTYLHAASADENWSGEYAKAFRYTADFDLISEAVIAEKGSGRRHNDLPILCSGVGDWTSFAIDYGISDFARLGTELDVEVEHEVTGIVPTEGATLLRDPWTGDILMVNSHHYDNGLSFNRFDEDMKTVVEEFGAAVVPSNEDAYWAQAAMTIGQHVVVAFMSRDKNDGFADDWGDVWIAVFDQNWDAVEVQQVSHNQPPGGGMRPGLARKDDILVLSYDRYDPDTNKVIPGVFELKLDLDALGGGAGTGDTGFDDPDPQDPDDGESTGTDPDAGGCFGGGDSDAPPPPETALILVPWLYRLRRRPKSSNPSPTRI